MIYTSRLAWSQYDLSRVTRYENKIGMAYTAALLYEVSLICESDQDWPTQEAKRVMMHTAIIANFTLERKTADPKCTFVLNAQYLNYDEVYKMMEQDGIYWTFNAGVNLFKWKLFTEFVYPATWGVSFMKKHAKNLIVTAQDCILWPFIQYTLDIFLHMIIYLWNSIWTTFRPTIMMFTYQMFCGTLLLKIKLTFDSDLRHLGFIDLIIC